MKYVLMLLVLMFVISSCARRVTPISGKELITDGPIVLKPDGKNTLSILYTGCGGMVIKAGKESVMTDPYYTGHGLGRVLIGKIKMDTVTTQKILNQIKDTLQIKTVLISHSHYDHLEDLPWMLKRHKLPADVKIIGSPSASCAVQDYIKSPTTFINADLFVYHQDSAGPLSGKWIVLSKTMRVMPLEARHAPHIGCIHLMKHDIVCNKFKDRDPVNKGFAWKWQLGHTYSFLLDVFSSDYKDTLRIFIQTSSCNPPYGFPPAVELGKKSVDIAVLCVASYKWIDNYPEAILSLIKPKRTILVHWENFFADMYPEKHLVKNVPATPLKPFMKRLRKHYHVDKNKDLLPYFIMPKPLTTVQITY